MSSARIRALFPSLLAMFAAAAGFVVTTATMDTLPDAVLVGIAGAAAAALVVLFYVISGKAIVPRLDRSTTMLAVGGGVLAFWAAPLLALSQRATDAPSGTDALFLTTTAVGVMVALVSVLASGERFGATALGGAVAALAGTAGLLGNWESPSSFSPFGKFPEREWMMLLAAAIFAVGLLALDRARRRSDLRRAALLALPAAAAVGLVVALPFAPAAVAAGASAMMGALYLGFCVAGLAIGALMAAETGGLPKAAAALLGAPLGVMLFALTERLGTARGPDPVAWRNAAAGIVVLLVGIVVVWLARPAARPSVAWSRLVVPLAFCSAAAVLGVAQLLTPALNALSEGGTGAPFRAEWLMSGVESASGLLVFAASALVLSAVFALRDRQPVSAWTSALVASLVCLAAAVPLASTTLHTWNRWIPADVQQTYGTEYSRLVTTAHLDVVRVAAAVAIVCAIVATAVYGWRTGAAKEEEA